MVSTTFNCKAYLRSLLTFETTYLEMPAWGPAWYAIERGKSREGLHRYISFVSCDPRQVLRRLDETIYSVLSELLTEPLLRYSESRGFMVAIGSAQMQKLLDVLSLAIFHIPNKPINPASIPVILCNPLFWSTTEHGAI